MRSCFVVRAKLVFYLLNVVFRNDWLFRQPPDYNFFYFRVGLGPFSPEVDFSSYVLNQNLS